MRCLGGMRGSTRFWLARLLARSVLSIRECLGGVSLRELARIGSVPAHLVWLGDNAAPRGRNPDMVNGYTPDEFNVRMAWVTTGIGPDDDLNAEFDRFVAKVKADALREAAATDDP